MITGGGNCTMNDRSTALERWEKTAHLVYDYCRHLDAAWGRLPNPAEQEALKWVVYAWEDPDVQQQLAAADNLTVERMADLQAEVLAYILPDAEDRFSLQTRGLWLRYGKIRRERPEPE